MYVQYIFNWNTYLAQQSIVGLDVVENVSFDLWSADRVSNSLIIAFFIRVHFQSKFSTFCQILGKDRHFV